MLNTRLTVLSFGVVAGICPGSSPWIAAVVRTERFFLSFSFCKLLFESNIVDFLSSLGPLEKGYWRLDSVTTPATSVANRYLERKGFVLCVAESIPKALAVVPRRNFEFSSKYKRSCDTSFRRSDSVIAASFALYGRKPQA